MHTLADATTCLNKSFWKYLVKYEEGGTCSRIKRKEDGKCLIKKKKRDFIMCISVPGMEKAKIHDREIGKKSKEWE